MLQSPPQDRTRRSKRTDGSDRSARDHPMAGARRWVAGIRKPQIVPSDLQMLKVPLAYAAGEGYGAAASHEAHLYRGESMLRHHASQRRRSHFVESLEQRFLLSAGALDRRQ